MKIREAKDTDADALSIFATQAFYDAYGWYNTPENMQDYVQKHFSPEQLIKEFSDKESVYLLATDTNENDTDVIIGYAKFGKMNTLKKHLQESHSEIERIYVDSSLQRKGIGLALIQEIIQYALRRNNQCVWLGVWQKNEKAVNFYLKNGFEIIGNTQFILGDDVQDDYLMKLNLNN